MGTIVGCDFHPSYQQIAMVDTGTGDWTERALRHEGEEVRRSSVGTRQSYRADHQERKPRVPWQSTPGRPELQPPRRNRAVIIECRLTTRSCSLPSSSFSFAQSWVTTESRLEAGATKVTSAWSETIPGLKPLNIETYSPA
jgi:hypothetical protein